MKRRDFIVTSSLLGLVSMLDAKCSKVPLSKPLHKIEKTIALVQEHLFPQGSKIPSAQVMNVTQFLIETITHETYDRDIRLFVIEGAEELERREKGRFGFYLSKEREKALRRYEETSYGRSWLTRIMTLTMEGIFGDPVYGSNLHESGWKALDTYGGLPRPKGRYIDV